MQSWILQSFGELPREVMQSSGLEEYWKIRHNLLIICMRHDNNAQ